MARWYPRAFGTSASALRSSAPYLVSFGKPRLGPGGGGMMVMRTDYLLLVAVQRHGSVGLDEHFDQNNDVVVPGPDALHEPGAAKKLFVDQVSKLGDVETHQTNKQQQQREALA